MVRMMSHSSLAAPISVPANVHSVYYQQDLFVVANALRDESDTLFGVCVDLPAVIRFNYEKSMMYFYPGASVAAAANHSAGNTMERGTVVDLDGKVWALEEEGLT